MPWGRLDGGAMHSPRKPDYRADTQVRWFHCQDHPMSRRHATCAILESVEVLLSIGAVEVPDARLRQYLRRHQASVHAHPVVPSVNRRPMGDAPARWAAMELDRPIIPRIDVCERVCGDQAHLREQIVSPQHAIPTADGAVAIRDLYRRGVDLQRDSAAMTGCFDHFGNQVEDGWATSTYSLLTATEILQCRSSRLSI